MSNSPQRTMPAEAFHLADAVNWPGIQRDGLLCATSLLRRAGLDATAADHRGVARRLEDGVLLRDQAPIPPAALERCLDPGLRPQDWYALLNGCIFFWLDRERVRRHLRAQQGRECFLMVIDTERLLARCEDRAFVTPFNTGSARRRPARRGTRTLVPVPHWRRDGWAAEAPPGGPCRRASTAAVELVVQGDLPDVFDCLLRCERFAHSD